MPTICSAAAVTVAAAYCVWRACVQVRQRRERQLRRRVAYMLWVMAGLDESAVPWHVSWGSSDY
jgi:hypothetical protein